MLITSNETQRIAVALANAGLCKNDAVPILEAMLSGFSRQDRLTASILAHFDDVTSTTKSAVRARAIANLNAGKSGKDHLQRKVIRNIQGEEQTVWVNPDKDKRIAIAVKKAFVDGDLPSRKEGAQIMGDIAVNFLRNPIKATKEGNRREELARKLYELRTGSKSPTRMQGVGIAMRSADQSIKKFLKSTDASVGAGGILGSIAGGAVGGFPGALAGDLAGGLVVRKAIEATKLIKEERLSALRDLKELLPAGKRASEMKDPQMQMQIEKDLVGDVSGWAIGNASAQAISHTLGTAIPGSGGIVAMTTVPTLVSPVAQRAHDLVRAGVPAATAARTAFREYMELGDKREQEWRAQFKGAVNAAKGSDISHAAKK